MKQKLTLLLIALFTTVGAWATTYTITYGTQTGTFYNGSGSAVTSGWIAKWVSNEANKPVVTLTASANNINAENGRMAPGQSQTCTYTLYVEGGYKVTGFSMNCPTFNADVTITPTGESATTATTGNSIVVNSSAASFVFSGNNSGRIQAGSNDSGSFTITVEEEDWAPSIEGAFLTVGNKVSSFTAATAADDNDHWYILTQVRGGETPMYNTGAATARLMRASNPFTLSSLDGALTSTNSAYLIRFKSVGEGTYNIQFANGYWIDGNLNAANFNTAGTYAFYNCNGGSGSYFAWNLNSKSGSIVDNNAAGNNLAFWSSGEVSNTSGNNVWYMYETEVEVPASTIDVTYAQYVDGAATGTTFTETVLPNSAINVPSSFYTGYSSLAYDYSTSGTIADADVTIQVNIDRKSDVKLPAELSNSKKYQIICERGGLSTYYDEANSRTVLASPVKTELGVSAKEFAILNYDSKYYLYSVSDSKFVTYQAAQIAPLADMITGTSDAIAFSQTTNSVFVIRFDNDTNKNLNSSVDYTYGIVINDWGSYTSDWDGGCQYVIKEVGDFDATSALAALNEYFNGETAFNNIITALKTVNWGLTSEGNHGKVNYYNFTENASADIYAYAGNEMSFLNMLEGMGYSADNLQIAQSLNTPGNAYALNVPAAGFYRIKGHGGTNSSDKYLAAGMANSKFAMSDATDATTIFYFDGTKLTNFSSGMCNGMTGSAWAWVTGDNASTVEFQDGLTNGGYAIKSATCYFYDGEANADRGNNMTITAGTDNRYTHWYLEKVTTLPVTLNAAGSDYYATLCLPCAATITDATAYTLSINQAKTALTMEEVSGTVSAGTPVLLKSTSSSATATLGSSFETNPATTTSLAGTFVAMTVDMTESVSTDYFLGVSSGKVGFYHWDGETLKAFRAYLPASAVSGESNVKGFALDFDDDATSINEELRVKSEESAIFNLAGQRLQKMQKGVNIINGKKIIK